jgi:outer membrane receptor protein involved in Fe transport
MRMDKSPIRSAGSLFAASAALIATLASPETRAADDALQEIVVTSTKREQSLQQVPLSVTALSSVDIEDAGIRDFSDYAAKVPNLTYSSGFGVIAGRSIAIRGVQGANTTGFYIDDMPVPSTLDPRVLDLERIEVLRGPQGTLYGARSMGGTVRLITEAPELTEFSGKVHALGTKVDDGGRGYQVDATLNVPLIDDRLGVRLNAFMGNDGSFIHRVHPSATDPAATVSSLTARSNFNGASLSLLWKPVDGLTVRPFVMTQTTSLNGWPLSDNYAGSLVQNRTFDIEEPAADHWTYAGLSVDWSLPLGDITSASGYFNRNAYEIEDVSEFTSAAFGVPPIESPIWTGQSVHTFVEEARFNSKFPGPVQLIAGLYYTSSKTRNPQLQYAPGIDEIFGGALGSDLVYAATAPGRDTETAVFGEITYNFAPGWSATFGARESHIKTSIFIDWTGAAVAGVPGGGGENIENSFTPKFSLKYELNEDVNLYATAAKGFRPGNGQAAPPPSFCAADYAASGLTPEELSKYNSDSLWSYEVGAKTRWLDRRLTINGAAYQINWSNLQQQSRLTCGFTFLVNAGAARSRGGEIELEALPFTGLEVSLGVGYEDAVITSSSPQLRTQVGSPVQQVAPWTVNTSVQYTHPLPLPGGWEGLGRIDYNYTDHSFSANEDPTNPRLRKSYQLTNIRAGLKNRRYQADLFVENLLNVHANLGDDASEAGEAPGRPRILVNPPRTFGLEGTVRF